jgi:predicted ester cyclase/ketosteroid isomerase-like protein
MLAACGLAAALTASCKKDDADKKGAEQAGASAKTTVAEQNATTRAMPSEELVKQVERCIGFLQSWDKEAFRSCFADKAEVTYIDNIPPSPPTDRTTAVVQAGSFRNAFPDFKAEVDAVLVNDRKSMAVSRVTGTHKTASMGMAPTGKSLNLLQAQVAEHDQAGQVVKVRYYLDYATLFNQLGVVDSPGAPKGEQPWQPVRVVAKKDAAESANLETVKKALEALGKSDIKAMLTAYAPDATFRYLPSAAPYKGAKEIETALQAYVAISTDYAVSVRDAWAAGDWVVVEMTARGKLAQDIPGAAGSKGKPWELSSLDLFRLAGGKIVEHWSFANGLKFATDVGMFDPASLTGG